MKKKIITMTLTGLMGLSFSSSVGAAFAPGTATFPRPEPHIHKIADLDATCTAAMDNLFLSIWMDPGMWVATGIDMLATNANNTKTVDAKEAIEELEKSLEGSGSSNGSSDGTAQDASTAQTYTPEVVSDVIDGEVSVVVEVSEKTNNELFDSVRSEITEYLTATSDADIKGDCTNKDSDCTKVRQNEWLLASVTLASATADKVLETTVKSGEKDETNENGETSTTSGGNTPLAAHFQGLASDFNSQTVPTGMYDAMANIVLDTHRQINEANALMGRDLEAQGLRGVVETGVQKLNETEG